MTLPDDTTFDPILNRLEIRHNHGFFSNCTATLWALTSLYPRDKHVWVDWSGQDHWRDKIANQSNLFNDYFAQGGKLPPNKFYFLPHVRHHEAYDDLNFSKLRPYIEHFFQPSEAVAQVVAEFAQKYQIDYRKTVGLCYRGTDKWHEIGAIGPEYYFNQAQRALEEDPTMRLLIQTDEGSFRDKAMSTFGERAFFIEELPVTYSRTAMHFIPETERHLSNYRLGVNLLAAVIILSRTRYVISHTGNVGLWIYLFRGHSRGACQLLPSRPEIISNLPGFRNAFEKRFALGKRRIWNIARDVMRH